MAKEKERFQVTFRFPTEEMVNKLHRMALAETLASPRKTTVKYTDIIRRAISQYLEKVGA